MSITDAIIERSKNTEHGFNDLQLAADVLLSSKGAALSIGVALELLKSDIHQARCVGTFVLGRLASSNNDALRILKDTVSQDEDWRVQEILAKAFDNYCRQTGYEEALPIIHEWLNEASPNIRRAVTEGLRIWTSRPYFRDHPEIAIRIISSHRSDKSEYLRKSVGNALRDISKKHPDLIRKEIMSWDLEQAGVLQVYKLAARFIA
ncbi:DNA alkylation repair protein [Brucellaceae bacterium C25G]